MRPLSALFAVALAASASSIVAPSLAAAQADSTLVAPKVVKHTVKPGDTLWDIAKFYLKDPFKWPEVFHANTDIVKNPHWIYPGQVLTIEGSAVRDEVAATVGADGFVAQPVPRPAGSTVFLRAAPPQLTNHAGVLEKPASFTVRKGEYEAAPYVVGNKAPLDAGKIIGRVDGIARGLTSEAGYKLYDRLYVTAPAQSHARLGTIVVLARRDREIMDVGTLLVPTGLLRVDSIGAQGVLLGTIVRQFQAVRQGEITLPYDGTFVPTTVRPVNGSYATSAKIVWIANSAELPSLQTYVVLRPSDTRGIRGGDQFTVYNGPNVEVQGKAQPTSTATVQIVRVTPFAATGIIVDQTQPMVSEGMPAKLTARMP
jgi:LysM repeat protein